MKRKLSTRKRVQFAEEDQVCYFEDQQWDDTTELSERRAHIWYTAQELQEIHNGIQEVIGIRPSLHPQYESSCVSSAEALCFRGLEYFASNARRELKKHFVKGIIETQRRLRHCSHHSEEPSSLIHKLSEKHTQYARERAHNIALHDARDARAYLKYQEEAEGSEQMASKFHTQHRAHTPPRMLGTPNTTAPRTA